MPDIQFPWALPRRKTLAPDGSYRDSPYVSDANGITGQGPLVDNGNNYAQDEDTYTATNNNDTVTRHSPNYSDNPPPIKPTESSTSPTTAQTNPAWASGDRIPGGPPGYTPGPIRPLYEGMTPPKAYTDYQEAIHDPGLHPKTSAWRQILGGVVGNVASGILSPLGDVVRYGGQGSRDLRDAQYRLGVAEEARKAQLAQDRESQLAAYQASSIRDAEARAKDAQFNRDQLLQQRRFDQGQRGVDAWNKMYGPGGSAQAEPVPPPPDINLSLPAQAPPSPSSTTPTGPTGPSIGPVSPTVTQSIPSRPLPIYGPTVSSESLQSQGFTGTIPPRYSVVSPPREPQWSSSGAKVEYAPPGPSVMVPPRDVLDTRKAEETAKAQQVNWIPLSDAMADSIGLKRGSKAPKEVVDTYLRIKQTGDDAEATRQLRRDMAEYARGTALMIHSLPKPNSKIDDANQSAPGIVEQMLDNPDIYHGLTPAEKTAAGKLWNQRTGLPVPVKLSTTVADLGNTSQNGLQHVANVRQLLKDPVVLQRIGPALGRLGTGEQWVGDSTLSDADNQKISDLRSSLTYLFLREGKILFGGRPPEKLMNLLEKTSPRASEIMPMLEGQLNAVERTAKSNIMSTEQARFGGKIRPGFKPGFATQKIELESEKGGRGGGTGGPVPQVGQQFNGGKVLKVTPIP